MLALGVFLFSFLLAYFGTVLLLKVRLSKRFMDVPNLRSSHEAPKPRFGGIAIIGTFLLAFGFVLVKESGTSQFVPLLLGAMIVFGAGVLDDWRSLPVSWRFLAQGAAIAIVVGSGHVVDHIYLPMVGTIQLGLLAIPFTVFFILTSINFYNFIDGIDGLAAGSAFIAAGFLALIAYMLGHGTLALVCLAMAGSTLGFLQFNFPPSRLFMGDSGSTSIGFFFAYVAISGNGLRPEVPFFIPVLILSSLYLDAGLTLAKRAIRGEKIFKPHHTHYYQRLLSLGLNHKQVTVLEYGLTILLGISALVFVKAGGFFPFFVTLCWVVIFGALILKIRGLERGDRLFWERRSLLVIGGDLVAIAVAYFGAYFLRMNFRFTDPEGVAVLKAFPFVLVVRSACFYWYGLYRGVWKYTSTPDVLRIIKAVTAGSVIILALVVLFYRFVAFPRSLFVIEYFLLILALGGSRFAFRLFHEFGKEAHGADIRRVGVIGAGDYAERLGREIRNAEGKSVSVVCYVDDDKDKVGLVLQGVPIVGPIDNLAHICKRFDLHSLVLGISNLPDNRLKLIVRQAREANIPFETRETGYVESPTGLVELDRIARELGRELPIHPMTNTGTFFEDKRVLITDGGGAIGVGLADELVSLGARVTVHVGTHWEAGRFGEVDAEKCRVFIGGVERELDAARLVDAARPDVVFYCSDLCVGLVLNRDDYLWRRLVRATSALCAVLPKHPIESLVFLNFWGHTQPGELAAHLSATGEIMALNSSDLLPAAPKIVRLPTILTGTDLRDIAVNRRATEKDVLSYELLEGEAIAISLDVAANYKGRVILVPRAQPPVNPREIRSILKGKSTVRRLPTTWEGDVTPLFPNEQVKASVLRGAQEVVSPSYPASDELLGIVSNCVQSSQTDLQAEHLAGLHAALFERARAIRFSAE
jgi:UDP-GlcNAc:undecaprenyl-phosphate GlcNAc-1-phosphate transferase